jgi:glycosyltransferase involved in cell wall biosynthesis
MPRFTSVPAVVTLHDATFFSHPQWHSRLKVRLFTAASRRAVRSAACCVVPSAATRNELVRWTSADPAQIHVVPLGVDHQRFEPATVAERQRVAERLGVTGAGYVAFLGTLEPRKNVPALIRAFVRVAVASESPPALVLAGAFGWDQDVEPALASVPRGVQVVQPGYLPLADLPAYLAGALVVAYPSLGEGFGLPVLEAMACGACVLTTRRLSLPEVGGDAVAYTEPDATSIAAALDELLQDPERRVELGHAARTRAELFTWRRTAEGHLAAYEQARRTA